MNDKTRATGAALATYVVARDAYYAASNAAAAKATATGMPNLTGSEKQVSWALTIRDAAHADLSDVRKRLLNVDEVAAIDVAMAEFYAGHLEARWWIDHRNESIRPYITPILHRILGR